MIWIVMAIMLVVCSTGQWMLPDVDILGQAKVPVLLGMVLYYALNHDFPVALIAAFLAGVLQDVLGQIPLGYSSLCFCLVTLVMARFHNVVMTESTLTAIFFGAITGVAVTAGLYGLLCAGGYAGCSPLHALVKMLGNGLLAAICSPVVFRVNRLLDRMVEQRGTA